MNLIKRALKIIAPASIVIALAVAPAALLAQSASAEKQTPPTQNAETPKAVKKPGAGPFHGKLVALDKTARTITVGKRTFQITSETRINKTGKPATLEQAVVGEPVSGYVKPNAQGKLVATTVNLGPKSASKTGTKETQSEGQSK